MKNQSNGSEWEILGMVSDGQEFLFRISLGFTLTGCLLVVTHPYRYLDKNGNLFIIGRKSGQIMDGHLSVESPGGGFFFEAKCCILLYSKTILMLWSLVEIFSKFSTDLFHQKINLLIEVLSIFTSILKY